jgi:signal transduction histidine kinase
MFDGVVARSARSGVSRIGAVLVSTALALLSIRLLDGLAARPSTLAPCLAAVMFSSWYGGVISGLLATLLNSLAFAYFSLRLYPPAPPYGINAAVRLSEFVAVSVLICLLNAARSAAQERAEIARAEAEAANRTKDHFLAMVSHELRTPLHSILGWAHLLQTGKLSEAEFAHGLEMIANNTRTQARLVDELLDISRIVSGKLKIQTSSLELAPVVEEAVNVLRPAAQAKGIHLETALESGCVLGDRDRLHQVVCNLLTNAIKFTPNGGRVHVKLERAPGGAQITIADTGIGISREFLPRVFDRFSQAETSADHRGLGLGLAIVRHIVELHGGTVEVESQGQGKGATFIVRLPLTTAAAFQS